MAFNDTFERLERLAYLIQRKATGSPEELARRLGVSVRTTANLIEQLRMWGAEIAFCRERGSYYFVKPVNLRFSVIEPLEEDGEIKGGRNFSASFFVDAEFLRWGAASL